MPKFSISLKIHSKHTLTHCWHFQFAHVLFFCSPFFHIYFNLFVWTHISECVVKRTLHCWSYCCRFVDMVFSVHSFLQPQIMFIPFWIGVMNTALQIQQLYKRTHQRIRHTKICVIHSAKHTFRIAWPAQIISYLCQLLLQKMHSTLRIYQLFLKLHEQHVVLTFVSYRLSCRNYRVSNNIQFAT